MGTRVETGQSNQAFGPVNIEPKLDMSAWRPVVQAAADVTPLLADILKQFWGVPVRLQLLSVSFNSHYFWRSDDYHVSQLVLGDSGHSVTPASAALLRISDMACAALLSKTLGDRTQPFSFKQMSPLEATILNDLSRDILGCFTKHLFKKNVTSFEEEPVHFVWMLEVQEPQKEDSTSSSVAPLCFKEFFELGKIVLSVPPHALHLPKSTESADDVVDDFFFHVISDARISLGTTRLPMSDVNHLEPGDWVVLEQSDSEVMAVMDPNTGACLTFSVEIPARHRFTVPYTQEYAPMNTQAQNASDRQNLWDNLMIEVNAEFVPVKLPLKQLKQMSEGLIVEVGDLVNNRICLQVDGETLAWGELIIVGDKFGVRVTQVDAKTEAKANTTPVSAALAPASVQASDELEQDLPEPVALEAPEKDDDLDNFLNDDFDEEENW